MRIKASASLVIFGLLVSVPFILGGSQIILKIIDRFPIIVYAGGALLGWMPTAARHRYA